MVAEQKRSESEAIPQKQLHVLRYKHLRIRSGAVALLLLSAALDDPSHRPADLQHNLVPCDDQITYSQCRPIDGV